MGISGALRNQEKSVIAVVVTTIVWVPAIIGGSNLWPIDWFGATLTRFMRKFTDVRVRKKLMFRWASLSGRISFE